MSDKAHTVASIASRLMVAETGMDVARRSTPAQLVEVALDLYILAEQAVTRRYAPASRPLRTCGQEEGSYHPSRPCERHPNDDGA